ncbi:unnamed protein product [Closterium sp. Naga37s-1]|nr:unnamed protein product [Closterium sp. Naga37s-1]
MNPCGRLTCKPNAKTESNTCDCTIPGEANQPFVEVANGLGSNTCAYGECAIFYAQKCIEDPSLKKRGALLLLLSFDVCSSYPTNPCGAGTCINDGKGAYSCICPPNYISSTTIDSVPTCDPGAAT